MVLYVILATIEKQAKFYKIFLHVSNTTNQYTQTYLKTKSLSFLCLSSSSLPYITVYCTLPCSHTVPYTVLRYFLKHKQKNTTMCRNFLIFLPISWLLTPPLPPPLFYLPVFNYFCCFIFYTHMRFAPHKYTVVVNEHATITVIVSTLYVHTFTKTYKNNIKNFLGPYTTTTEIYKSAKKVSFTIFKLHLFYFRIGSCDDFLLTVSNSVPGFFMEINFAVVEHVYVVHIWPVKNKYIEKEF